MARHTDMSHALAVEETLARVRLVLTMVSAAAVVPLHLASQLHVVLVIALVNVWAVSVLVALRLGRIRQPWHIALLHGVDFASTILATWHSGGATSPYSTLFLFTLLAAGYRWGRLEVWATAAVGIAVMAAQSLFARMFGWDPVPDPPLVALRLAYLGLGGVLVGYMAGVEQRQRLRAVTATRILSRVGAHRSVVSAVHVLVNEILEIFEATELVMAVEEDERDGVTVWRGSPAPERGARPVVTVGQDSRSRMAPLLTSVPPDVAAWLVIRNGSKRGAGGTTVVAVGHEGQDVEAEIDVAPLLDVPFTWQRAMVLSYAASHGLNVRLFLFLPPQVRATRRDLQDLQVIMREVGSVVVNLYLQRRLQSRSAIVERTRISRELHDGVIQALIGVEMQLEVTRRQAEGRIPERIGEELKHIQEIVGQEVLNVRDLMQMLKPMDVDASRLVEYLASTVEQFRQRTGIKASFSCGEDDIDLSPRSCREVAAIVQEALANVRKHSEATAVMVRLDADDGQWRVTIDDDGKGLDFEGSLTHEDLEAQRKGPVLIKERVRSIHGRLAVHSHRGFGTRLDITIPRKHHA